MDNIQKESSVRFTLLFHTHRDKMESVNQNLNVLSTRITSEIVFTNFFHS